MGTENEPLDKAAWAIQPSWSKLLICTVGIPAWLVIIFGVFSGSPNLPVMKFAGCCFGVVAVINNAFVFRALWRGDL